MSGPGSWAQLGLIVIIIHYRGAVLGRPETRRASCISPSPSRRRLLSLNLPVTLYRPACSATKPDPDHRTSPLPAPPSAPRARPLSHQDRRLIPPDLVSLAPSCAAGKLPPRSPDTHSHHPLATNTTPVDLLPASAHRSRTCVRIGPGGPSALLISCSSVLNPGPPPIPLPIPLSRNLPPPSPHLVPFNT